MKKIDFQIVTPEKVVSRQEIDALTCPTTSGQITILPSHIPLISKLEAGALIAKHGDKQELFAISGGFIEVRPGNKVIILTDTAERDTEIDAKRAEEAKARAQAAMQQKQTMSVEEYASVAASLQKNLARLKVARKKHPHRHQSLESAE